MDFQFCSVFLHRKRLFLTYQEKVGGPRRMRLPPRELDMTIDTTALGLQVLEALGSYRDLGHSITADEWEGLNERLLELFGEKSVSSFERRKKDVTIRRDVQSGGVRFSAKKNQLVELDRPDPAEIGGTIKKLLGIG